MIDVNEIKKTLDVFRTDNGLLEIRIFSTVNKTEIYSGIFDNDESLIKEINKFDKEFYNIYFIFNELKDALNGLPQLNKMLRGAKTITDRDIKYRRWLLFDFDPIREGDVHDIASTEEEFENSKETARKARRFLLQKGFKQPVVCFSGNGTHLIARIDDIPCNEETDNVCRNVLKYIAMQFTDDKVDCDIKVSNRARLTKFYSSVSRKGGNTKERPHRKSEIVVVPPTIEKTPFEALKSLSDDFLASQVTDPTPSAGQWNTGPKTPFDIDDFLSRNGLAVLKENRAYDGGRKIVLKECPFDPSHGKDSAIFVAPNGAITFTCFHQSCSGHNWRELRLKYDPHAYDRKENTENTYSRNYSNRRYEKPKYKIKEENPELGKKWFCMSDIKKIDLSSIKSMPTGFTDMDNRIVGLNMGEVTLLSGSNSCVDCDTEFFNGKQWKRISEYKPGEKVLQYNPDGSAELVYPSRYIKEPCSTLHLMKSARGVNQCLSDEHSVVYCTSYGNLAKKSMKEIISMHNKSKSGFSGKIYTTFRYSGKGIDLTDEQIRIMCAVICDGYFNPKLKNKNIVRINIKKERKKERLEKLLKEANIDYRKEQYAPNDLLCNTYLFISPRAEKEFGEYWYECNAHQLAVVADEILNWDGCVKGLTFSQNSRKTIDFIQFAFASIGRRASIYIDDRRGKKHSGSSYIYKNINYALHISTNNMVSLMCYHKKAEIKDYNTKDGYKYCFTVPSGMLVLRREGNINITGNSGKSSWINSLMLNVIDKGYKVALWSGELRPDILKAWIQMVAAGKRNLRPSKIAGKYYVPNETAAKIDEWLDGKLFLYNNEYSSKWEQIFNDMKELLTMGVSLFILDNLFSLDIDLFDGDKNNKQKELIIQICNFAKSNQVHILLVAHPRKSMSFLRKNDISGTADLTNAVDNVFICHRVNNDFIKAGEEFFGKNVIGKYSDFSNCIEIAKNRLYGVVDYICGMFYEIESRRFKNEKEADFSYGWETDAHKNNTMPYGSDDYSLPFSTPNEEAPF